jgi:outer membrane receptor protein involved in Fe transport
MDTHLHAARLAAALCVTLGAPAAAGAQDATSLVRGVVFGPDGAPVAGALVTVGDQSARTNADGGFALSVPVGEHDARCDAPGFVGGALGRVVSREGASAELVVTLSRTSAPSVDLEGGQATATQADPSPVEDPEAAPGRITGVVRALDSGRPIEGARVFVRGAPIEAATGADGAFALELPPGTYDLSFIHPDHSSQTEAGVEVASAADVALAVALAPAALALQDFVVTAPRIEGATASLLEERQEASTMNEVLGAEQFSKSGDSSAASALKRVTGLTVVGGRFVYIRGLGGRYSSTLLNGATLPSTEPDKRAVPLDLFPSALLESITIQKTYSPDMPGDFGGGVVQLATRSYPTEFEAMVSGSAGYLTGTTFTRAPMYQLGLLDPLGIDDGGRRLPDPIRQASEDAIILEGDVYSAGDVERLGEELPNAWGIDEQTLLPNVGLGASVGDGLELFGATGGWRAALTYSHAMQTTPFDRAIYNEQLVSRGDDRALTNTSRGVILSGMLTGGLDFGEDHRLRLTTMLNRVTDDDTTLYTGFSDEELTNIAGSRGRWQERQIFIQQVAGEHDLAALGLTWRYVFSQARMDEPYRRDVQYLGPPEEARLSRLADGNTTLFSDLVDNNHDAAADVTRPMSLLSEDDLTLKAGAQAVVKSREVDTKRYKYNDVQNLPDEVARRDAVEVFVPEYIGDPLVFAEITRGTDNYTGLQVVGGAYAMADWTPTEALTVSGGLRLEYSYQQVTTFNPYNRFVPPEVAELGDLDPLPALNATYALTEGMQVRAALARTVTRPNFRELSPAQFNVAGGGIQYEGNIDLERAPITHADARWEWYPSRGESVSVGAFYKHFERPIELTFLPGATTRATWKNLQDDATNLGAEVEFRKNLSMFGEGWRDFYVSANAALVSSTVVITDPASTLTSRERPMLGQSPYVFNAQVGYDGVEDGLSVTALYNVFGPRIVALGDLGLPDVYEQSVHSVDVVASYKLGDWSLSAKAKNLVDQDRLFTQSKDGETVVFERYSGVGRGFSLGLGRAF